MVTENDPREWIDLLDEARGRRAAAPAYCKVLYQYGSALVGKRTWKKKHLVAHFSDYVSVADEAFLWLCLDTYLPRWNKGNNERNGQDNEQVLVLSQKFLKDKGHNVKTANGNRCGWTREGIDKFNYYFGQIRHERQRHNRAFDVSFKTYCQEVASTRRVVARRVEDNYPTAYNCL